MKHEKYTGEAMRDYATVSPQFWLGKTGRELRKSGPNAQVVAFYLMTSPHANMLGLYYLPVLYLAHETGLGFEGASEGLKRAIEAGFCSYDHDSEMVWVHEMAAYQVGRALKPGDNRCAGVRNEYASLPENPFLPAFFERYQADFHMTLRRGDIRDSEGASKPPVSQDQDQDQEQDQDKHNLGHGGPIPPVEELPPDESPTGKKKNYPPEFEEAWASYPKRAGGNSKADALKAWTARIKSGATAQELIDGTKRYAVFVKATGKLNTEFVKQAATFFGPAGHYAEAWTPPVTKSGGIEPSGNYGNIPNGFRG